MAASRSFGRTYREGRTVSVSGIPAAEQGSPGEDEQDVRPIGEDRSKTGGRFVSSPIRRLCCHPAMRAKSQERRNPNTLPLSTRFDAKRGAERYFAPSRRDYD